MNERYGRDSRYRRTPTVTRLDHTGRVLPADDTRLRPVTPGTFTHTVDGHDRLDHLGQRYYGKPHKWWAIADANPEFTSPLALLGLDPITAVRVTLGRPEPAPWEVLARLRALVGVEDVGYDDSTTPPAVFVTFNRVVTTADAVLTVVRGLAGPGADPPPLVQPADRVGKPIVVPPEPAS